MSDALRPAVVTGAGQGLGRAVALAFAREGRPVVVSDLRRELVDGTSAQIHDVGGTALSIPADVASEDAVLELAERARAEFGPLGVWVNNAGVSRPAMLHKMNVADFDLVLAVHARGTFLGIREAARRMIEDGGGSIINVTSSAGLQGTIGQINYAAAKGAVISATKSAALELARYSIRVNAVAPLAATPMTEKLRSDPKFAAGFLEKVPLKRFGDVDEIAASFVFLGSPSAGYITGQVMCVDGGLYMAS